MGSEGERELGREGVQVQPGVRAVRAGSGAVAPVPVVRVAAMAWALAEPGLTGPPVSGREKGKGKMCFFPSSN